MYVESSSPNSPDVGPFILEHSVSEYHNRIDFYYSMWDRWGIDMGTLSFETYDGTGWSTAWSKTGNQGTAWHYASVSLPTESETLFPYPKFKALELHHHLMPDLMRASFVLFM